MIYIGLGLKFLLFIISNIGYWELLRRKTRINILFLPSLTIAMQVTVLFFAGLSNLLFEATIFLYLLGFFALAYFLYKDKSILWAKEYLNIGFLFLLVGGIFVLFSVKGKFFTQYDDFSHWALVVKNMLGSNRYPNFKDSTIMFQQYPLGTASYIYFSSVLVSKRESFQMLSQAYILLASIMPIFIACRKNKAVAFTFLMIASNFMLTFNTRIQDLMVDTVLPIAAMCALFYSYTYLRNMEQYRLESFLSMFYMVFVLQIKNSGVFFIAILSAWIIFCIKRDKRIIDRLAIALSPFITILLWSRHCSYVFQSAETSKHAMTSDNYISNLTMKTKEEAWQIIVDMIKFSVTWKYVWLTVLCLLLVGVLAFFVVKSYRKAFIKVFLFCLSVYTAYQIGMLLMYLFSMPSHEATLLAGSERYCRSMLIAILYCTLILFVGIISEINMIKAAASAAALAILLVFINNGDITTIYSVQPNKSVGIWNADKRVWLESTTEEYKVPLFDSYCILVPNVQDYGYTFYLGQYVFLSNDVSVLYSATMDDLKAISAKRVLNYDAENEQVSLWLAEQYPDQIGSKVIITE